MSSLSCGTLYSTIIFRTFYLLALRSSPTGERSRVVFYVPNISSVRFWWFGGGVIPVLIPNTAVKPASGDGTHRYRWGE